MNFNSKLVKTGFAVLAILGYTWSEGAFCKPATQTRVACQNRPGFCSIFAWNYKIYYTKYYECCYNDQGQYTHKNITGTAGPTEPTSSDCCTDLVNVSFTDDGWTLPCAQTASPPEN